MFVHAYLDRKCAEALAFFPVCSSTAEAKRKRQRHIQQTSWTAPASASAAGVPLPDISLVSTCAAVTLPQAGGLTHSGCLWHCGQAGSHSHEQLD